MRSPAWRKSAGNRSRIGEWTSQLARGEFPAELRKLRAELLYAPDRNKPETKALEAACKQTGLSVARLFERCGELRDTHAYHFERFLFEFFPAGTAFPPHPLPEFAAGLPLAAAEAFSLDDGGTTEIDDAFSLAPLDGGGWRLGIHISAPALGFAPGSALDAIARERLSTVYMPGNKLTMLPDDAVAVLSLDAGTERPVVSLYFDVSPGDYSLRGRFSRLERVRIAANLRHELCTALNQTLPKNVRTGLRVRGRARSAVAHRHGAGETARQAERAGRDHRLHVYASKTIASASSPGCAARRSTSWFPN